MGRTIRKYTAPSNPPPERSADWVPPPPYCVPNQGTVKARKHVPPKTNNNLEALEEFEKLQELRKTYAERTDDKRTKNVTFRLTEDEYNELKEIAQQNSTTVSLVLQQQVGEIIQNEIILRQENRVKELLSGGRK